MQQVSQPTIRGEYGLKFFIAGGSNEQGMPLLIRTCKTFEFPKQYVMT